MRKALLVILIMLFSISYLTAQERPKGNRDLKPLQQIEEWEKIKLIEVLNLKEEASVRFFARRNEHQKRVREIFGQRDQLAQQIEKGIKNGTKIPDAVYQEQVNKMIEFEAKIQKERESFIRSLSDILSPEQIVKLTVFEIRFRKEVRDRLMNRGKNHPQD